MGQTGLPLSISYGFAQSVLLNWILEINCIATVESFTREPCTSTSHTDRKTKMLFISDGKEVL